jgi:hypothetical protein
VHAQTLTHRYSFNDNPGSTTFTNSVAGGASTGTLAGNATLDGTSLVLDGQGSFATLPPNLIAGYSSITVEFWASFGPENPFWTRVFAFGNQNENGGQLTGLDYSHYAAGDWQNLNLSVSNRNVWANNPGGLNGVSSVHVTVIVDPGTNKMLYYNGTRLASNPAVNGGTVPDLSGINDEINLIGKSLYDVDATLAGAIHEFRIYQGALSATNVAINDAAGPDNYVTDPGALQAVRLSGTDGPLVVNQNFQQLFFGDFANVSNVNLSVYGGANFTSSNPAVFTVDPGTGLVRAIAPGIASIVASYGVLSATNILIVAANPAVLTHRYTFDTDASDTVGNADATLMGNATISGAKVVLDGSAGTYVDLPAAALNIATNPSVTFDIWVTFGETGDWSRLFDFGEEGGAKEIYFTPKGPGNGTQHRLSENIPGGATIDWVEALTNDTVHLTTVIDPPSSTLAIYRDGKLEYARYDASASLTNVSTNVAVLGRSLVAVDPFLAASIDEFRFYSGALTPQQIALIHQNGPGSTNSDVGALNSLSLGAGPYPANSSIVVPSLTAGFANLTNFNLFPNNSAAPAGLKISSSDTNIVEILENNLLRTHDPGNVTLIASYMGLTNAQSVTISNLAQLTHRYSFTNDANDAIGQAHGILRGNATVSGGRLVLDGTEGSYLELPGGILQGYDAATIDIWVTFNEAATWARLWYFGDDRANEFYFAPSVLDGNSHWLSTGFPVGGETITRSPRFENQTLHITSVYGNGTMELYTNAVLEGAVNGITGRLDQVGKTFSWIGRSPYQDPFLNASVDEFRVYLGRLSPEQIAQLDVLGPDRLPEGSPVGEGPILSLTRTNGTLVFSWPAPEVAFSLQSTTNLLGGTWSSVTNTPTTSETNWQVTLPIPPANAEFYRLAR